MRTIVISQPFFFPWVGMLEQMRLADVYVHYDDVQFSKGSFTNRVQIKTAQGTPWLTVPVHHTALGQTIAETRTNESGDWRRKHLETLRQAYAHAPFRDEMLGIVSAVCDQTPTTIAALSAASIEALREYFGFEKPCEILWSSQMGVAGSGTERVLAICRQLGAQRYVTGHGAREYLEHEVFDAAGVSVEYLDYQKRPYPQQHGEFTPFVSALDLVANCGRAGREVIASGAVYWKDFLQRT